MADGLYGRYYFGWYCLADWSLDVLDDKYDTSSLTDVDMRALAQAMGNEFVFEDIDDEFDRALLEAARTVGLRRLDGCLGRHDEGTEGDKDDVED